MKWRGLAADSFSPETSWDPLLDSKTNTVRLAQFL